MSFYKFYKRLTEAGYKASDKDALVVQGWLLVHSKPAQKVPGLLLLGPAGTGKTFFAKCLARAFNFELLEYQCHYGTGKEELLYDLDVRGVVERLAGASGDLAAYLRPGILPQAILAANEVAKDGRGVVLLLDEVEKTRPEVDAFLLGFMQSGRIYDPHLGEFFLKEARLYVIATSNQDRLLSEPLMRRFRRVYVKYPPAEVEAEIIKRACSEAHPSFVKGLVSVAGWLRQQEGIMKPPATPELINLVRDVLALDDPALRAEVALSWLTAYEEDRTVLEERYPLNWWVGMLQDKDIIRSE